MGELADRVFIITGARGAVAASIVRAFSEAGARLALVDHRSDGLDERARAIGGLALAADLARADGAEQMARATLDRFGRVDGLVHTVGGYAGGPIEKAAADDYDR